MSFCVMSFPYNVDEMPKKRNWFCIEGPMVKLVSLQVILLKVAELIDDVK